MARKSRHVRDESDPLLGFYSQTLQQSSTTASSNPLYSSARLISPSNNGGGESSSPVSPLKMFAFTDEFGGRHHHTVDGNGLAGFNSSARNSVRPKSPKAGYRVHRHSYTAQNHVQVLFRMYGSAFPSVMPFVLVNVLWTFTVEYLKNWQVIDLTFHSSVGHSFMGLLVSFLIVSRSKISHDRFMEFRKLLAKTYRSCRELAQLMTVYTFQTQTPKAKEWRQEVAYRTILLLRVTMDALLWSSTEHEQWENEYFDLNELMDEEAAATTADGRGRGVNGSSNSNKKNDSLDDDDEESAAPAPPAVISEHFIRFRKLSHGRRSMIDENFRAPITFAHRLQQTIMQHPDALGYKMAVNEYRDLVNLVTIFTEAFHGFRVLIFTPYPFPLVQMTRAFLFFWVYTLPPVLLKDYRLWSSVLIVTLVSFGFIGIEYVSMALDDPFGDDTNDVDEHGMALLVYEDIYLTIYRTDGPAAAFKLRERVLERYKQGRGLDCYRDDLKGYDIWEPAYLKQQSLRHRPPSPPPPPLRHRPPSPPPLHS